jgi:poly-beta-1,6-N-acetyl-D-glucosamine biosynthesis protein PgaD
MNWPPLIRSDRLPRWIVARDMLATVAAWVLLLFLLRDFLWMLVYWLAAGVGIELAAPWARGKLVRDLVPFLLLAGVLVLWLAMLAVFRWQRLTSRGRAAMQPAPLDRAMQLRTSGLDEETRRALQDDAIVVIRNAPRGTS